MSVEINMDDLKRKVLEGAIEGLEKAAELVKDDSKKRAPVKTGALRDSIEVFDNFQTNVKIGTHIYYGFHQHETNPNGKAFYLRNAVIENENTINDIVAREIENKISR